MKDGFLKIASCTPNIKVCDCIYNKENIISQIQIAKENKIKFLVFPELCVAGYTCGDMFFQNALCNASIESVVEIAKSTAGIDMIVVIGVPIFFEGQLYNCATVINDGKILGIVPKNYDICNSKELEELRYFNRANKKQDKIKIKDNYYHFGENLIFKCSSMPELSFGVVLGENNRNILRMSSQLVDCGANMIVNISASSEQVGKAKKRISLAKQLSENLVCTYILSNSGEGESTSSAVFSGHNIISENGKILTQSELFQNSLISTETDLQLIEHKRKQSRCFVEDTVDMSKEVFFRLGIEETLLTRFISPHPFFPNKEKQLPKVCETIFEIQSMGLKKRLQHTNSEKIVIGISGGLDSTLALLVAVRTMEKLKFDKSNILAVTMPCFGTTDRTLNNSKALCELLGIEIRQIDIKDEVLEHFKIIDHDKNNTDVTYENAQARIRTLVLMDLANSVGGLVVGTGDLSELALGWATYGGDHMSMYTVNSGVPKTIIRHLISYESDRYNEPKLSQIIGDILDTPISPELLPPDEERIAQKTEDKVGPYDLHDFFLYYAVYMGFSPKKVYRMAKIAFVNDFDDNTIKKWEKVFYRRFFSQQFKRACSPDGAKIGSVSLSPKGDFEMPSDASADIWLNENF